MKKQIVHYALRSFLILFLASLSQALYGVSITMWNNTDDSITLSWTGTLFSYLAGPRGNKFTAYDSKNWVDYIMAPKTSATLSGIVWKVDHGGLPSDDEQFAGMQQHGVGVRFKGNDANKYYFLGEKQDTYSELNVMKGDWKVSIQKK